jgi:hypothetical protein
MSPACLRKAFRISKWQNCASYSASTIFTNHPPLPPPILIVTDDTDTPYLIELRLARAARVRRDATLAEIDRMAADDAEDAEESFEPVSMWVDFLHSL